MSLVLATSALLLGLAGGPHCAVMCGALQAGVARRSSQAATSRALVWLHGGRLVGYSAAGALVAVSVSALSSLGSTSAAVRPVWTMLQAGALVFGCVLAATGKVPGWLSTIRWRGPPARSVATVNFAGRVPSGFKAAAAGACWAAMPCGLLQSALIVAALASSAAEGAAVMSAFAIGTSLSLFIVGSVWGRLGSSGARWGNMTLSVRMAGGLLAAASAVALFHGLGSAIEQVLCL